MVMKPTLALSEWLDLSTKSKVASAHSVPSAVPSSTSSSDKRVIACPCVRLVAAALRLVVQKRFPREQSSGIATTPALPNRAGNRVSSTNL
jgi:hypothetical protein